MQRPLSAALIAFIAIMLPAPALAQSHAGDITPPDNWPGQPRTDDCRYGWVPEFPQPGADGLVTDFATFDDGTGPAVYAVGQFTYIDAVPAHGIARWDGTTWSEVGGGLWMNSGEPGAGGALVVHDDGTGPALYVVGHFERAGDTPAVSFAKWNGTTWTEIGGGIWNDDAPGYGSRLILDNLGEGLSLFVSGSFNRVADQSSEGIASWNGSAWTTYVGGLLHVYEFGESDIAVLDSGLGPMLYVAGIWMDQDYQTSPLARWNGTVWEELGEFESDSLGIVQGRALTIFDDGTGPLLYLCGTFAKINGQSMYRVSRFDGTNWASAGGHYSTTTTFGDLEVHDTGNGPQLYAGGYLRTSGESAYVARFDGSSWVPVENGPGYGVSRIRSVNFDGMHLLFAGGDFVNVENNPATGLAYWDGTNWFSTSSQRGLTGTVRALGVFDPIAGGGAPELFVAGNFFHKDGLGAQYVTRWDGQSWQDLPAGLSETVRAMTTFNDGTGRALYVGGNFSTTYNGAIADYVARWDGTSWSPLGLGLPGSVYAICTFDDGTGEALYAGGDIHTSDGSSINLIARWNGLQWESVGGGMSGSSVYALAVHDDGTGPALYAGGRFSSAGGAQAANLARWNGTTWSPVGGGDELSASIIYALEAADLGGGERLYAGGNFPDPDVFTDGEQLKVWDGHAWSSVGGGVIHTPLDGDSPSVHALRAVHVPTGPLLVVGGYFDHAGGQLAENIAAWDGLRWHAFGNGIYSQTWTTPTVYTIAAVDEAGTTAIYAGGTFTNAGGLPASNLAKWTCVGDFISGDTNCDGVVNADDVTPFVQLLTNRDAYFVAQPNCDTRQADVNGDGVIDLFDIDPFIERLYR